MAQTQRCSRGSCAHASRPAKVKKGIFGVSKALTHSFGTSWQPKSCHCHKNLRQHQDICFTRDLPHLLALSARSEVYPCSQDTQFVLAQQLPEEGGFTPTPALCGEAWIPSGLETSVTSSSLGCRAQRESFSHGDYVAESPAWALNPAVSSGHDGPRQNVT